MNEFVSASYTLTVYDATEHGLDKESVARTVERLLHLTRFSSRNEYIFKLRKFHSSHTAPTFEFEHTGTESIYLYRCRIGNIAGMTGIFLGVLRIPDTVFHSGITTELNAAAVKLLAEIQAAPPIPVTPTVAPAPEVPPPNLKLVTPIEPRVEAVPLSTSTGAPRAQKNINDPRPRLTASQLKEIQIKLKQPKQRGLKSDAEIRQGLTHLKRLVATECQERRKQMTRLAADIAGLNQLRRDLEELGASVRRQAEARERLKKFK